MTVKKRDLRKRRRWLLVSSEKWGKWKAKAKKKTVSKQRIEVVPDIFQSVGVRQTAWIEAGEEEGPKTLHLG